MMKIFLSNELYFIKKLKDIMKFGSIFTLVFLAFMFALNNLFWYYQQSVREPVDIPDDTQFAGTYFGT
jgi:hypothetical protein